MKQHKIPAGIAIDDGVIKRFPLKLANNMLKNRGK
jgi:hypothetical protein